MQRYVRRKERDLKEGQTLLGEPQELTESEKAVLNLPKVIVQHDGDDDDGIMM